MTQHLGTPPRPWAGLETHLYAVPALRMACTHKSQDAETARRRKLATLSLALAYLARRRASASADIG